MSSPDIQARDIEAVLKVLRSPYLSLGPNLSSFERRLMQVTGAPHAVAVSSGTAGLHLCAIAAGIRDGNYAITSPFSFIASANSILYERGVPVFVDVDEKTGNIDPGLTAEAAQDLKTGGRGARRWLPRALPSASSRGRLKALLPIHAFGQPADMDPLLATAKQHGLSTIEDACEALGAEYRGRKAGALGDAGVFAFYPNKQMTTGEGGVIVTNNGEWAGLFRSLRNQGRDVFDAWLNHRRLGYNYRLDEMSAALGWAQAKRVQQLLARRALVASWYFERLAGCPRLQLPSLSPTTTKMSWFVFVVRLDQSVERDRLVRSLESDGIPTRPYFSPIHLQPFYRKTFGYRPGDFPITERLGRTCLALPFSGVMTRDQVDRVCDRLLKTLDRSRP